MEQRRDKFGSRFGVVAALSGSAIGLGNIWRFPYMVGEHGGACFILVYLFCALFISLPVLYVEQIIGRRAGQSSYLAMDKLSPGGKWNFAGKLSVIGSFTILSYYSVVGGWSMDYLFRAIFSGFDYESLESSSKIFSGMSSSIYEPLLYFTLFLAATSFIVIGGVKKGIEKFSKFCIPLLFLLIIALTVFSISLPGSSEGVNYLIKPDFSKFDISSVAYAMGQSFFSMSVGIGCVITYGSYMSKKENIAATGIWTTVFDTIFALISGFAIMPAVFVAGLEPGAGPALIFETLPYIFARMAGTAPILSRVMMILFFLSILIAALTSSISLLEVCVSNISERKHKSRQKATLQIYAQSWIVGALCSLSFGVLSGLKLFGLNIFSLCDTFASNFVMIIGALAFTLFVGWKMKRDDVRDEFTNGGTINNKMFNLLYFLIRWVLPVVILAIFASNFIL